MNGNHSQNELIYRPRWLAHVLREVVEDHRVIVLTGARQVGKSTLLRNEKPFAKWHYINLDDYDVLSEAQIRPGSLWINKKYVIIDEVQKAPRILEAVKIKVDTEPNCRFILSGSSNLLLMKQVSESLAGRAVYFSLNPLCFGEVKSQLFAGNLEKVFNGVLPVESSTVVSSEHNEEALMWQGFMPTLLEMNTNRAVLQWWDGYVRTFLERDLRQISQIDSLPDFRRVMTALALRCGQILNETALSRDLRMSQATVHRYINLLEISYMVRRLPTYRVNRNKRLMKAPKVMWNDPGLAAFLCGYETPEELKTGSNVEGIFESMIYMHLHAETQLMTPASELFYWRTSTNNEVDFVIKRGSKLVAVEVKLSSSVHYADLNNLRVFMEEYPETVASFVLYTGDEIKVMDEKIIAVPWYLL